MRFSATDAAFEGFRLVRRNPMALVFWTLAYMVLSVTSIFAMIANRDRIVGAMETLEVYQTTGPTTPEDFRTLLDAYGQMTSYSFWILPVSVIVGAMLSAAVARGVLFPEQKKCGFLRLGMDEVRVFVVTLVIGIGIGLLTGVLFMIVAMIAAFATVSGQAWLWLLVLAGGLAVIVLAIWLSVRLSLAVPATVAEKKFAFVESFPLTRGRFWPLFGMAVIAFVMAIIIWMLSMIVVMPLGILSGMGAMGMSGSDPSVMLEKLTFANPLIFLSAVANAIVYALMVGILYAPFSAAYRDLKAGG